MITIRRTHEIAVGHRVFGHESKCAHLHGHNYTFELVVTASALDDLGRVVDFSVLKSTVCEWLETHWDHKMLLWFADPLVQVLTAAGEPVWIAPCNPTAEKLAAYVGEYVAPTVLPPAIRCVEVVVWETGKCSATWRVDA